jgi:hypothetical protein
LNGGLGLACCVDTHIFAFLPPSFLCMFLLRSLALLPLELLYRWWFRAVAVGSGGGLEQLRLVVVVV